MKRILIPLFITIPLSQSVNAGIPSSREVWQVVPELNKRGETYMVNVSEAKATSSYIKILGSRRAGKDETSDGKHLMSWTAKVKVNCKTFKSTYTVSGHSLIPFSRTKKIQPDTLGYVLADNLCYLTGVEGYTANENPSEWVKAVVKQIESKPFKKYIEQGSVKINCDSPVWKNKPRCN